MNNVVQPLKFYNSINLKNSARDLYTQYRQVIPLWVDSNNLLPFALKYACNIVDAWYYVITSCIIYNKKTGIGIEVVSNMSFSHVNIDQNNSLSVYKGLSVITTLKQGVHYIYVKNEHNQEFWSEDFNVGFFTNWVKFNFRHSKAINNLWFATDFYYNMTFQSVIYDTGEYQEYKKELFDDYNHPEISLAAIDKLWGVDLLVDRNVYDCLKMLQIVDTVLISDNYGISNEIKITDVKGEAQGHSNYIFVTLKYRITESFLSTTGTFGTLKGTQIGTAPVETEGYHEVGGHHIVIGGDHIKTK